MNEPETPDDSAIYRQVVAEIKETILTHRYRAAKAVNRELLWLNWLVGRSLARQFAEQGWGAKVLRTLSNDLQGAFPGMRGFSERNLRNMQRFAEAYPELDKVAHEAGDEQRTESRRQGETYFYLALTKDLFFSIGFTHHILLLNRCKDLTERRFYMEETVRNQWTVETLDFALDGKFYQMRGQMPNTFGTYLPESLKETALLTFRDEYLLDFVNVDPNDERVLERHIVQNIQRFLLSLGKGFTFIGSQYRQVVDGDEYYVDLLFYNRVLKCLVAIDLKKGEFKPEYAGKMNFYLNALNENEKMPDENPSIGIVLCKSKSKIKVGFAFKGITTPMGVASYKLSNELPGAYRDILPDTDTLTNLLNQPSADDEADESVERDLAN
jgi:predicted nuclease of restriction endonuclease-like (RecB) superfamily